MEGKFLRKPEWLKIKLGTSDEFSAVSGIVHEHGLHTICSSGKCPNMNECWSRGTATFMILGSICTRKCKFCATATGVPLPVDKNEPAKVAASVALMKLKHTVITSVDRDDLEDAGAEIWAETIRAIRERSPSTTIEVLIPDMDGKTNLLDIILDAKPDIVGHNIETVRRMTPLIRSRAKYELSLSVLKYISEKGMVPKSGMMLGIGESDQEVMETMKDLRDNGCEILTLGQYLQPTKVHHPVDRYVHPDSFEELKNKGMEMGFSYIEAGPLVRSSYMADKAINSATKKRLSISGK